MTSAVAAFHAKEANPLKPTRPIDNVINVKSIQNFRLVGTYECIRQKKSTALGLSRYFICMALHIPDFSGWCQFL